MATKYISSIIVTGKDGVEYHHERQAKDATVTNNIHGFDSLEYFLPSDVTIPHNDIDHFLIVKAYYGLTVVFDGRMKSFERVIEGDTEGYQITCKGWQDHCEDQDFVEVYEDDHYENWEPWGNNEDNSTTDNNNRLYMAFAKGTWGQTADHADVGYYALDGQKNVTMLRYDLSANYNDSYFDGYLWKDIDPWVFTLTAITNWNSAVSTNITAAPNSKYVSFGLRRSNNVTGTANHWMKITNVHLTTVVSPFTFFSAGAWPIGFADEVIRYTASAYCPMLSNDYSGLKSPSSNVFPLVFDSSTKPKDVFDNVALVGDSTTSSQWDWAIWTEKKLELAPRNLTGVIYYTAMADGMQGLPNTDGENISNKVMANFTNHDGHAGVYTISDYTDVDCPLNRGDASGTIKTHTTDLGTCTSSKAATLAAVALAQVKYPMGKGAITLTNEPKDSAGSRVPLPTVRAGNLIRIRDFIGSSDGFTVGARTYGLCDFYVVEAVFNDTDGTLSLTLDNSGNALEHALAGLGKRKGTGIKKKAQPRRKGRKGRKRRIDPDRPLGGNRWW